MKDGKNSDIRICEFEPEYRDGVILLIDSILKELNVVPDNGITIDDPDLFKIPLIYSGKSRFWVALKEGHVVGTVGIKYDGKGVVLLKRMFVKSEYRGMGIAQKLLSVAINFARENKYKILRLRTHFLMTRAHKFYEKNGFKRAGQTNSAYRYRLEI